jgi:hypothetical protein
MAKLYAAARLYVNFFQPSFKLKEKRREDAKVIKRYHDASTPYERVLAHPIVAEAVKEVPDARSSGAAGCRRHAPRGPYQPSMIHQPTSYRSPPGNIIR